MQARERFIRTDFKKVDADGNGTIDRNEAERAMRADFKAMDLDRNGVVTLADIQRDVTKSRAGKAKPPLSRYLPYDTNGDGKITEQEYLVAVRRQIYEPMDSNRDGKIALGEALAFHTARKGGQ